MASTSKGSSSSKSKINKPKTINPALIEQFCSVTGADENVAQQMLTLCEGNLEMAVNMHVDSSDLIPMVSGPPVPPPETDGVRAPIPPTQGVLVEEPYNFSFRGRKRPSSSVFDGFRDFQAETRWQEQELGNMSAAAIRKRKTLEDLFRPPLDLIHRGTFESARDVGQSTNRWLMVNVQNGQEFACQALNRDVWSNQSVKNIVKEHFVFWQVYHDSAEGMRFNQFYKVEEFPYVGILDPRTGEKMFVWDGRDATSFCEAVLDFLSEHPSPDGTSRPVTSKKVKVESIVDISEDQQMEAAIKASLEESKTVKKDNSSDSCSSDISGSMDLETFDSEPDSDSDSTVEHVHSVPNKLKNGDSQPNCTSSSSNATSTNQIDIENNNSEMASSSTVAKPNCTETVPPKEEENLENHGDYLVKESEQWKDYCGAENDPKSELLLRFPSGSKEKFCLASSSQLKALFLYVASQGYSELEYELVTTFPKRQLNSSSSESSLKELGLFPRETIYIQLKNS